MTKRFAIRLLVLLSMLLFGSAQQTSAHRASHDFTHKHLAALPTRDRSDHLWGWQERRADHTALVDTSTGRCIHTPRAEHYTPTPLGQRLRTVGSSSYHIKFNPYRLITPGWRRRLLHATHPYALVRYYVIALRHIIR